MTALSKSTNPSTRGPLSFVRRVVKSGVTVYKSGHYAIEIATGKVYVPVGNTANEVFAGIAMQEVVGDGSKTVELLEEGEVQMAVAGVTGPGDEGKVVYETNDGTPSLTDTTADLHIGKVSEHVSGTTCWVRIRRTALT